MVRKVTHQVVIEEFLAVVTIEALQRKGQPELNVLDLNQHAMCTFVPGGAILGPGGENIRHGQ